MINNEDYKNTKSNIRTILGAKSEELLPFLQKFYAVNVVRELVGQDKELRDELNSLTVGYLKELYDSDVSKRYINGLVRVNDDRGRMSVTTMALMETVFPEFLDGSFNPNSISEEVRQLSSILFMRSSIYKYSTDEFRDALDRVIKEPKRDRSSYDKVDLSLELKELLYEDYLGKKDRPYQRS